jgi:hypothetical protein
MYKINKDRSLVMDFVTLVFTLFCVYLIDILINTKLELNQIFFVLGALFTSLILPISWIIINVEKHYENR